MYVDGLFVPQRIIDANTDSPVNVLYRVLGFVLPSTKATRSE